MRYLDADLLEALCDVLGVEPGALLERETSTSCASIYTYSFLTLYAYTSTKIEGRPSTGAKSLYRPRSGLWILAVATMESR